MSKKSKKTSVVPKSSEPLEIRHRILDEILEGKQTQPTILQPTSDKIAENRIFDEIMAKMKTRRVTVEQPAEIYKPAKSLKITHQDLLANLISQKSANVEIEASFGIFNKGFEPGFKSTIEFSSLREFLGRNEFCIKKIIRDTVEIQPTINLRCIITEGPKRVTKIWQTKKRELSNSIELRDLGVRITKSTEVQAAEPEIWNPSIKRHRQRESFSFRKNSEFEGFVIDMSRIQEIRMVGEDDSRTFVKNEVEIEYVGSGGNSHDAAEKFLKLIKNVYNVSVSNGVPFTGDVNFDMNTRRDVVKFHNDLFARDLINPGDKFYQRDPYALYDQNYWNKPVNIKLSAMKALDAHAFYLQDALVAVKRNGQRFFMLFTNGVTWLIWPPYAVIKFGTYEDRSLDGTYLDGELKTKITSEGLEDYTYYVFDVLFYKGKDVRLDDMIGAGNRFEKVKNISDQVKPVYGSMKLQTYYSYDTMNGSLYNRIDAAYKAYQRMIRDDPDSADGLIIQSAFKYYSGSIKNSHEINKFATYKWKPADQLTIDFKISKADDSFLGNKWYPRVTTKNLSRTFILKIKKGKFLETFYRDYPVVYSGDMILSSSQMSEWGNIINGQIVECKWNESNAQFEPVRLREDKAHPNNFDTAKDVWEDIHNPIEISTLTGKNLVLMRKFHNQVKNMLLSKYVDRNSVIVDIGSGRGGDFDKWKNIGIQKVYAIEPSLDEKKKDPFSVSTRTAFYERLESLKYQKNAPDVVPIKYGIHDSSKIRSATKSDTIDTVVAFFSLTFLSESEEKFKAFMKTIDKLVPKGGKFIGIVMDGESVFKLLDDVGRLQSLPEDKLKDQLKQNRSKTQIIFDNVYGNIDILQDTDFITNELMSRMEPDYEPFVLGENPAIFNTDSYTIAQSGEYEFDKTNPFENEITITINDKTSMVDYTEWLFDYNHFKKNLETIGFREIESFFLNEGPAVYLPKDGFIFSSLNRAFAFERK